MKCSELYTRYGNGYWIGIMCEGVEKVEYILTDELRNCLLCERGFQHMIIYELNQSIEAHLINSPAYIKKTPLSIKINNIKYLRLSLFCWGVSILTEKEVLI